MTLLNDVRFAARVLWKSPAFTAVAVVSLALGIGANTAVFSIASGLLSASPKVAEASRLFDVRGEAGEDERFAASYPAYLHLRDNNTTLEGLLCWGELPLSLGAAGESEQAFGMIVSGNYFDVLGVRPERGRFFSPEEDASPGAHPVAVISHAAWRRRFGADPSAVGRTVRLNGRQFTVIGVAPEGFNSTFPFYAPDVWAPLAMQRQLLPASDMLGSAGAEWLQMTGRLKAGVTVERAAAELGALRGRFEDAHPELGRPARGEPGRARGRSVELVPVGAFPRSMRGALYGFAALLLVIVNLVLFIACANLTSLLLARASARRRELAVRLALGAGRWRVVRQLLTESLMLCLAGGALGLLLALWMADLLLAFKPAVRVPVELSARVDWGVLAWTLAVSFATGVLFGLAPALQATRGDITRSLKDEAGGAGGRRSRLRGLFVAGQVAVTVLLLVSSGLFLRALSRGGEAHPGRDPERVQTATFDTQTLGYTDERARDFYRGLLERVRSSPGVEAAGLALMVPVGDSRASVDVGVEGGESFGRPGEGGAGAGAPVEADFNVVSPGYFRTVGTPLVRGRDFEEGDEARDVALVDEAFARRFFTGSDPLGKRVRAGSTVFEVVGVVRGGARGAGDEAPRASVYLPFGRAGEDSFFTQRMTLHARGAEGVPASAVYDAVRRGAAAEGPDVAPEFMMSLAEHLSIALLPQRVLSAVAGAFGALGLLLASVGVFGMVSYTVAQRTHEVGVRMALGARGRDVLGMLLWQGMKVTLSGVAAGLAGALALTRLLAGLLYGVSPTDPLTFALISLLITSVALLACLVPALRATKVDPMAALRYE